MFTSLIPILSAFAGWTSTGKEFGCEFYKGDVEGVVLPVSAECLWALPADRVQAALLNWADMEFVFSNIADSRVLATHGDTLRVMQIHQASGISDRETIVDVKRVDVPGGKRITWSRVDNSGQLSGQHLEVPVNSGIWQVTASPEGTRLHYEVRYDLGGDVPTVLVRWFQGSGMRGVLSDLYEYVEQH